MCMTKHKKAAGCRVSLLREGHRHLSNSLKTVRRSRTSQPGFNHDMCSKHVTTVSKTGNNWAKFQIELEKTEVLP